MTIDSIDLWESATTCSDTALLGPSERVFLMFSIQRSFDVTVAASENTSNLYF